MTFSSPASLASLTMSLTNCWCRFKPQEIVACFWSYLLPGPIYAVFGCFIPDSDVICALYDVIVFPKLSDRLIIFAICFFIKLSEGAMKVVGLEIQNDSLIHWLE
ncbi:hypothetical protein L798_02478 [Zootermopsis nevadensis]|uniref:Uncharacterized protein n=1 Tax=Zootermopsis nevadensis TaxID=136037 RepID=A0A067RF35_ZOONE|nr:hypothetical protein L798_02478 [Zootermopsis nevadensis]